MILLHQDTDCREHTEVRAKETKHEKSLNMSKRWTITLKVTHKQTGRHTLPALLSLTAEVDDHHNTGNTLVLNSCEC